MKSGAKTHFWQKIISFLLTTFISLNCIVPTYAFDSRHSLEDIFSSERSITIEVGETKVLSIIYLLYPWSSSDTSVVSVRHGIITGRSEGTATVTVKRLLLRPLKWIVTVEDSDQHTEHAWDDGEVTTPATCAHEGSITYTCTECGITKTESLPIDSENHESIKTETVDASCEEAGYERVYCEACGTTLSETEIPATGHTWNEGVVNAAATCSHEGTMLYTCSKCYKTKTEAIPVNPENHEDLQTETIEAACTADGSQKVYCAACDAVISEAIIPATGHDWNDGVVTKESSCTTEGTLTYICQNCGETYEESLPIDDENHINIQEEYTEGTCTVGAKHMLICEDCGAVIEETEDPAPGHTEEFIHVDPTETENGYDRTVCSVCGEILSETIIPAVGHAWDEGTVTIDATCVMEGVLTYTCKDCGATYTEPIPIDLENHENIITETTNPTCTTDGKESTYCTDCGLVIEETPILATGHSWKEMERTPATCSSTGTILYACQNCDETKEEILEVDSENHSNVEIKTTNATCLENGSVITQCNDCGEILKEVEIPALGHTWGEGVVTTEATCTQEGVMTYTCSTCGETKDETLPISPANHENVVIDSKGASCTEAGYETTYCAACNTVISHTEIQATGHQWDGGTVTEEATCIAEGTILYTCTVCGETYANSIPVDPSKHANIQEQTTGATCTEAGKTVVSCADCNAVISETEIPATGHTEVKEHKDATATEDGYDRVECSVCGTLISETIIPATGVEPEEPELDDSIVTYYTVRDGEVVDLVSGNKMSGATVSGEYFSGGTVSLPSSYTEASIEAVMNYNRESEEPAVGNGLSYYGGAFLFQEVLNPSNTGLIKVPFGGGQTGTNFRLHPSINYDYPVLGDGDSYWCLTFNADDDTYALQINDDYYEKAHWSNYINRTFTLSSEHQFKRFVVYSERLSEEEIMEHYKETGISVLSEDTTLIGRITDGITGLGSALAFMKTGTTGIPEWLETETTAGSYSANDGNGFAIDYTISDFEAPDNGIDNSQYESVHIIKKPETLYKDYKYALSAVPYPFNVNHDGKSDQYDVIWSSSDESVALVIDGLVVPQKTGTVTITATLTGTDISDSCTIRITEKEEVADRVLQISENYQSEDGDTFSSTDYEMTTRAIYAAIDEAYADGYNHVVFPQMDFYAAPIGKDYYIPTGMTVEFPEGSAFHMMPSDYAEGDGYTYFRMGWDWYDYNVPTDKAYAKKDDNGNTLGYYCMDAHLIIDQYYGEFYQEGATSAELSAGANEYSWSCVLLNIGRKAQYCTVEVHEAQCPAGFFILMGGKVGAQALVNGGSTGSIKGSDFVSGWLNDEGELVENENWISTQEFFVAEKGVNGTDSTHEYFFGNWEENVTTATQRIYDVLWYDEEKNLIEVDRWQYTDEKYTKPEGAVYFKLSIQQSDIPGSDSEYLRIHEDASSKFCEIRNTNIINGADGLASVVGATEACWIHDNYVSNDGYLNGSSWSLDLEDGWAGMRGTVIEHNIFRKFAYSSSVGEYRGMDSGVLALSSGYNTFVISNYLGAIAQSNGNVTNTHIINNVIYTMYGSISGGTATDIKPKIFAHVYNNIICDENIKENTSGNGVVYHSGNQYMPAINRW